MKYLFSLALLASGVLCNISPPNAGQEILKDATAVGKREKVPGANPAYFSRIPKSEQIFQIEELIISPDPELISANTSRLFTYLRGSIPSPSSFSPNLSPSILAFATLTLTATVHGETYEITEKISEHSVFSVRREGGYGEPRKYGGPLVEGVNEIVGDAMVRYSGNVEKTKVQLEAVARLPYGRVLFAVGAEVEVLI